MCSALSVRIVTVDSYMCAPHRNLDNIYSEFRGSAVYQVPVLRIFGSTEAGQKVCVHMHGVYPYLYIPHDGSGDANCLMYELAANIDKAINVSLGQASSKLQHVYKITLVSGIPFYGYHSRNHQFFKIYMYNPLLLRKVNNLLQSETILGKMYQPHESHIPFALQFMIDYNLHGMSFLNLSEVKYRVSDAPSLLNQTISSPADIEKVTRCEIEADALAENIMNKIDNFQENAASNPGIAALWDDERQRRRNKNEDSQLPHFLDAVDENYQNVTQSHLVFKNALEQRLILSSDKESEESVLNLSVYPAETPSSSKFLNASVVGSHCTSESTSMNDTSMFLSFIDDGDVTLQANQTIDIEEDADAQQLLVLLNELGQNAKEPEEDSILSQFQKDKEDEEENELNLTMSEITTPAIDDDLLNLSMSSLNIPQLDGNCSDELPPDMKSKKLGYCTCDKSKKNVKCKRCYQLNTTAGARQNLRKAISLRKMREIKELSRAVMKRIIKKARKSYKMYSRLRKKMKIMVYANNVYRRDFKTISLLKAGRKPKFKLVPKRRHCGRSSSRSYRSSFGNIVVRYPTNEWFLFIYNKYYPDKIKLHSEEQEQLNMPVLHNSCDYALKTKKDVNTWFFLNSRKYLNDILDDPLTKYIRSLTWENLAFVNDFLEQQFKVLCNDISQ